MLDAKSNLIVSLTTTSKRIGNIKPVLDSIFMQSLQPKQVLLFVSKEAYLLDDGINHLNDEISQLIHVNSNFKVIFTANTGPYRKIIPLLTIIRENQLVITADDDTIYPNDWILNLYNEYLKEKCVIAYRGSSMKIAPDKILPYHSWGTALDVPSIFNFATGKDGILYNTSFFHPIVADNRLSLELCPTNDDIWLKWATAINNVNVKIINPGSDLPSIKDEHSLYHNINQYANDEMINNVHLFYKRMFNFDITKLKT